MKFVLAQYLHSPRYEDHGVGRSWYCAGEGEGARWTPQFAGARQMDLDTAIDVYKRTDSPMRKLGLVPVE